MTTNINYCLDVILRFIACFSLLIDALGAGQVDMYEAAEISIAQTS